MCRLFGFSQELLPLELSRPLSPLVQRVPSLPSAALAQPEKVVEASEGTHSSCVCASIQEILFLLFNHINIIDLSSLIVFSIDMLFLNYIII